MEHEQNYVDRVYKRLDELVERASDAERAGRERGQLDYTGEIKEDDYRTLYERDVMVDNAVRRLAVLDAQREGLVFGRLDQTSGVVRYVGRIGIRDEDQEPLVVDWRAPAAAVFYQATPVRPMGVIRRRVLRTRGQQVIGLEDDLLDADAAGDELVVLGDGALMAALTAARGRQMRDIVSTIQREQDEIIRAPGKGATLISGGPGTGKTVVALHRAAYLLYTDRRRISNGGVLIVGPSGVFMNYIERVLPSLGETEATLRSIGEVMDGVTADRTDPYDLGVVKGSLRMRTVLARAVRDTPPGTPHELRIYLTGRILRLNAGELANLRHNVLRGSAKPNPARRDAVRSLQNALWRKANAAAGESGIGVEREEFDADLLDRDEFTDFVDAWWPPLTAVEVFEWLRDPAKLAAYAKGVLRSAEADRLARSWAGSASYSVQDVPLLDELHFLLGDPPPPPRVEDPEDIFDEYNVMELRTYGDRGPARRAEPAEQYDGYAHVLIDEAQDLSPMQWRMLGRRGARASWTIVGDPAQSSWPDAAEAAKAQEVALGKRPRRTFTLSTNYRNSAEIFELAGSVIEREFPEVKLPTAVRRTGQSPEHVVVGGEGELPGAVLAAVRELLPAVEGTIGVITTGSRQAEVEEWLAKLEASERGDRVAVLSGLASKGLEFDAVVVVEPGAIAGESPVGRRTLYVVLTRATQRLLTVGTSGTWLGSAAPEPEPEPEPEADTLF
ncbi:HelD family protein [Flindersiella endophytica]